MTLSHGNNSLLLAHCQRSLLVTTGFPHYGSLMWSFEISLLLASTGCRIKGRSAHHFRRHGSHERHWAIRQKKVGIFYGKHGKWLRFVVLQYFVPDDSPMKLALTTLSQCRPAFITHYGLVMSRGIRCHTVYPKKYAHGFVVLCFVVVMQSFIMNSREVFIHIHQGCFAGTGAIVRLPQCQWSKPDGYGKTSQCITTTKHSKAKTVCIFLGIYCTWTNNHQLSNGSWEIHFSEISIEIYIFSFR